MQYKDSVEFGTLGLINVADKRSFYKITAEIDGHTFEINQPDWDRCSTKAFVFE